jgi:IS4 transposase
MSRIRKTLTTTLGLAAAAAGAYLVYGRTAKQRRALRGWALKMKGEVLESMEKLKEVNEDSYQDVVDKVAKRYKKVKDINQDELKGLVGDLRAAWSKFSTKVRGINKT